MTINIRGTEVTVVTGDKEQDKRVAAFLSVALRFASLHAAEHGYKYTGNEYWKTENQLSKYVD